MGLFPCLDSLRISGEKLLRNGKSLPEAWASIMRIFFFSGKSPGKRFLFQGFVGQYARKETDNPIDQHRGGQLARGDHEFSERYFFHPIVFQHPLVDPLIVAAENSINRFRSGKRFEFFLAERFSAGIQDYPADVRLFGPDCLDDPLERFGSEDRPRKAPVRPIIRPPRVSDGIVRKIVYPE